MPLVPLGKPREVNIWDLFEVIELISLQVREMGTLRSITPHCFSSHLAPKVFLILSLRRNETLELGEKLIDDFEYSPLFALNRILPHMQAWQKWFIVK